MVRLFFSHAIDNEMVKTGQSPGGGPLYPRRLCYVEIRIGSILKTGQERRWRYDRFCTNKPTRVAWKWVDDVRRRLNCHWRFDWFNQLVPNSLFIVSPLPSIHNVFISFIYSIFRFIHDSREREKKNTTNDRGNKRSCITLKGDRKMGDEYKARWRTCILPPRRH